MTRDDVKVGDIIEVSACGLTILAQVNTVDYYYEDGWQIEMTDVRPPHTYRSWKQRCDGGKLTEVNNVVIKHQCVDCVNVSNMVNHWQAPCKGCSMNKNWQSAHDTSEEHKPKVRTAMCSECRKRFPRPDMTLVSINPHKLLCRSCAEAEGECAL